MTKQPNLPVPDPSWDYASIWLELSKAQNQLTGAITLLQAEDAEIANHETSRRVLDQVRSMRECCNKIERMLFDGGSIQKFITSP